MFVESLEKNSDFGGKGQSVLTASAQISQKSRASGPRGDDRIVCQTSERESVAVTNGPRGFSFCSGCHQGLFLSSGGVWAAETPSRPHRGHR